MSKTFTLQWADLGRGVTGPEEEWRVSMEAYVNAAWAQRQKTEPPTVPEGPTDLTSDEGEA